MKIIKILMIEDNPGDARLISLYLQGIDSFETQLMTTRTLHEAAGILEGHTIDIVLLDLGLPDGFGVNNITKILEFSPNSAIVIMTGVYDAAIASESIELGAQEFLVKGESDSVILERTILNTLGRFESKKELERERQRFRTVVDTALDAIITTNEVLIIQSWNYAAVNIFGKSEREMLTTSLLTILGDKGIDILKGTLSGNQPLDNKITLLEIDGLGTDGRKLPLEFSLTPWLTEEGIFYTAIFRDISERRKVKRMQSEFVSTVSHELRTPLTALIGSLKLVLGGALGDIPNKMVEFLNIALNNGNRLLLLINDILDMNKIESGNFDIYIEEMNLMSVIEQSISDNDSYAQQYDVSIKIEKSLPDTVLKLDPHRFLQIMANFLSNASKFSPKGGVVAVTVEFINNAIRISIIDHGAGIPIAFHHRVFHKFAQADSSDTRQKGGTGLGLNISKALAEKMGGVIGFESIPDVKTTFYVEFPYDIDSSVVDVQTA